MRITHNHNIQLNLKTNLNKQKFQFFQLNVKKSLYDFVEKHILCLNKFNYLTFLNLFILTNNNNFKIILKTFSIKSHLILKTNNLILNKKYIITKNQILDISKFKLLDFNSTSVITIYLNIINNMKINFNKIKIL